MKHIMTVMLAVLFISFNATAQNVNIGLNILRFSNGTIKPQVPFTTNAGASFNFEVEQAAGLEGGFYIEKTFNRSIALQAELLARFTTIHISSIDNHAGLEWTNGSVAVPVLFKYRLGGFGFMAGPEIGVNVFSDKQGRGAFINLEFKTNQVQDFERVTFAAVTGLEYTTRRPGIGVHVRYSIGLNSVWNKKDQPLQDANYRYETAKLNAFQFGLHWRFNRDHSRWPRKK